VTQRAADKAPRRAASRRSRTSAGSGLTASSSVTPEGRCARGASHAATISGLRLAVSRMTQPMALRMKNSFSVSSALICSVRVRKTDSRARVMHIYNNATARGKDHPHAVRILARAWLYVIWHCWHDHVPYDPARHNALQRILSHQDPEAA
jgi:hypothetical protein